MSQVMLCKHEYKNGIALSNLATNGRSTNPADWKAGECIFPSRLAMLIYIEKCCKCGHSR